LVQRKKDVAAPKFLPRVKVLESVGKHPVVEDAVAVVGDDREGVKEDLGLKKGEDAEVEYYEAR
jgi:hypothetical protein